MAGLQVHSHLQHVTQETTLECWKWNQQKTCVSQLWSHFYQQDITRKLLFDQPWSWLPLQKDTLSETYFHFAIDVQIVVSYQSGVCYIIDQGLPTQVLWAILAFQSLSHSLFFLEQPPKGESPHCTAFICRTLLPLILKSQQQQKTFWVLRAGFICLLSHAQ